MYGTRCIVVIYVVASLGHRLYFIMFSAASTRSKKSEIIRIFRLSRQRSYASIWHVSANFALQKNIPGRTESYYLYAGVVRICPCIVCCITTRLSPLRLLFCAPTAHLRYRVGGGRRRIPFSNYRPIVHGRKKYDRGKQLVRIPVVTINRKDKKK